MANNKPKFVWYRSIHGHAAVCGDIVVAGFLANNMETEKSASAWKRQCDSGASRMYNDPVAIEHLAEPLGGIWTRINGRSVPKHIRADFTAAAASYWS